MDYFSSQVEVQDEVGEEEEAVIAIRRRRR